MVETPGLVDILPYLAIPSALIVLVLTWARRRGASWTQVQLSLGAAILGAFMTASSWVFATWFSGEPLVPIKIIGSQLIVAAACGLLVFFGTMPAEQDVTDEKPGSGNQKG